MKMKLIIQVFLVMICTFKVFAQGDAQLIERSQKMYQLIRDGEFGKLMQDFDTSLSNRVDSARLHQAWNRLINDAGQFVKVTETTTDYQPGHVIVNQLSVFEKKEVKFRLVFGQGAKVKGISFVPQTHKYKFGDPPYYDKTLFGEKNRPLNSGTYRLPAVLSLPRNVTKPPVLILVHGSGPNDKDETVGNTKIFRDLSAGLSAQGVAVFRYDKRTRVHAAKMMKEVKKLTVKEEIIEDVLAAINTVKRDSTLDSTRIFILGHSLGGYLLPRIAQQTKDIKGLIMLAANARPMEDLMLEQVQYLMQYDTSSAISQEVVDSIRTGRERVKALTELQADDTTGVMGLPISYWLDLKKYDPVLKAATIKIPMLILHGERDYQVPQEDYDLWKKGLQHLKNVRFISYPGANHLFIDGTGKSFPAEYNQPGHLDKKVIDDIADFILKAN